MSAVDDFLLRHRLCADAYDWGEELARFLNEMDSVRRGRPGSLKMIPMALGTRPLPDEPVTVAAIDIGGTNVRAALVTLTRRGVLSIDRRPAFRTPGIGRRTRFALGFPSRARSTEAFSRIVR